MTDTDPPLGSSRAAKPITLIPVGLKEAALDSPTFRSGFTHFSEQLDLVEKWLLGFYRSASKLSHDVGPFESALNSFISQTSPPLYTSEAILDHDYTLLALKRYGECTRDFWHAALASLKKMDVNMVNPIKTFLHGDLQSFKDLKRSLEASQKQMDSLQSRYASQTKSKEPSSLREDAFQLHEARKAYLKISMDFSVAAPTLRMNLDKLLVKVFSDQWSDLRDPRLNINSAVTKWGSDIDRVRGWSREMENGEKTFKRELENARKRIEENAELSIRPSRELDDYATDESKQRGPSISAPQPNITAKPSQGKAEKQGWLMLRTITGKPSRTVWVRRWFYVKGGIFGWLVQGSRSGAVEESDRTGVLLCNVRASSSDDRRYLFEVKTADTTIVLQAENQSELNDWLSTFQLAKQLAVERSSSQDLSGSGPQQKNLAFAISPPSAPEFAAASSELAGGASTDDNANIHNIDRSSTLPIPSADPAARSSFDVYANRRPSGLEASTETSRDPTSRIKSKLDLHKRSTGLGHASSGSQGSSGGGIASLIAASHGSMPVGPGALPMPATPDTPNFRKISMPLSTIREMPVHSLAPSTLANPPAPTNLSSTAVIVNGERGVGQTRPESSGGIPSGLLANVWGSSNWGFLNRLERGEVDESRIQRAASPQTSLQEKGPSETQTAQMDSQVSDLPSQATGHRKTISLDGADLPGAAISTTTLLEYPVHYPTQLKMQDAQFRLLFPNVPREEMVILVFKATWNPNDQQEFPGRIYVTAKEIYFYSNYCGMTMTTSISLSMIKEVTAAKGRDWDVVFLHLKEATEISSFTRIMIKTFLEPLKLLQRRLSFLAKLSTSKSSILIEEIMKTLINMEHEDSENSPDENDWENVSINTPVDGASGGFRSSAQKDHRDLRAKLLVDQALYGNPVEQNEIKQSKSFKLPKQPVVYVPKLMDRLVVEKEFDVSPKALYHVIFGDRSVVWQLLYHERQAQRIRQGPWTQPTQGYRRREFEYEIEYLNALGRTRTARVIDHQSIDTATEHLLYCISDRKTPWHLPYRKSFHLLSKIVITHVAKARCKLAIYTKVEWLSGITPWARSLVSWAALQDMEVDALDLVDVLSDQVRRLVGAHGRTKKAIAIFGPIGQSTSISEFAGSDSPLSARLRRSRRPRTFLSIIFQNLASLAETVASTILQAIGGMMRWAWNTFSANALILLVLTFSILINLTISGRGTSEWWQERRASNLMARLGVGTQQSLSKSIFLSDLEQAATLSVSDYWNTTPLSTCQQTFTSMLDIPNGSPYPSTSASSLNNQGDTASRLRHRRQHLGSRRHDLLVAIRVINGVEREMMRAEWERWLLRENVRCQQLGKVIKSNETDGKGNKLSGRKKEVEEWFEDYCGSCEKEVEKVAKM